MGSITNSQHHGREGRDYEKKSSRPSDSAEAVLTQWKGAKGKKKKKEKSETTAPRAERKGKKVKNEACHRGGGGKTS